MEIEVRGVLDVACLRHAFRSLCARHDALRSLFEAEELRVQESSCLDFQFVELTNFELDWLLDQQYEVFNLETGPLCRVRVLQEAEDAWVLHWTLHHVSVDLWSYTILLKDLAYAYNQLISTSSTDVTWPTEAPQYRPRTKYCYVRILFT